LNPRPPAQKLALGILFSLLASSFAAGQEAPANVTEPPPADQFFVIPLRVHVLRSAELPDVNCDLADSDVARILKKANAIWHNAGIHWGLESLVREPAAHTEEFRRRTVNGSPVLGSFRILRPDVSREFDGLHVYYIHRFSVNGVFMGSDFAVVQETAKLREVEGGIDEPVPRVTAHELGHALGLPHRQDRTNLLASGTTGTLLNAREVEIVRARAPMIPGCARVPALREAASAAEARGDIESARRFWGWLAEIPGEGAEEARRHLERIGKS
jgi:hypothetical protein